MTCRPPIPDKLKELQDLFWVEAAKYQVLPLDASALTRFILPRPSIVAGRDEFTYTKPIVGVPLGTAPSVLNKSFTITADIEVPAGGGSGMLVTQGGSFGGWGFYLLKGKPVFVYDLLDLARPKVEGGSGADARQTHGRVRLQIRRPGPRQGRNGHHHGRWRRGGERHVSSHHTFRPRGQRDIRRGFRYRNRRERCRLPDAIRLHGKLNSLTIKLEPQG